MKRRFLLGKTAFAVAVVLLFANCPKPDDDVTDNPNPYIPPVTNPITADIDSALVGTSWKDNSGGSTMTIAFTSSGITWGGTAGNTYSAITSTYSGAVWIAKNGTISYKYSYSGGTPVTVPVYNYTLDSGNNTLELKTTSGVTFLTLIPSTGGNPNPNPGGGGGLTPDIDSALAGTSWKDNVTGSMLTLSFTSNSITWGGTTGSTLNSVTSAYQGTGYSFVWVAKNGSISYKYSYNGGTPVTVPVYTYTHNSGSNTLELKQSGVTFMTLIPQ